MSTPAEHDLDQVIVTKRTITGYKELVETERIQGSYRGLKWSILRVLPPADLRTDDWDRESLCEIKRQVIESFPKRAVTGESKP